MQRFVFLVVGFMLGGVIGIVADFELIDMELMDDGQTFQTQQYRQNTKMTMDDLAMLKEQGKKSVLSKHNDDEGSGIFGFRQSKDSIDPDEFLVPSCGDMGADGEITNQYINIYTYPMEPDDEHPDPWVNAKFVLGPIGDMMDANEAEEEIHVKVTCSSDYSLRDGFVIPNQVWGDYTFVEVDLPGCDADQIFLSPKIWVDNRFGTDFWFDHRTIFGYDMAGIPGGKKISVKMKCSMCNNGSFESGTWGNGYESEICDPTAPALGGNDPDSCTDSCKKPECGNAICQQSAGEHIPGDQDCCLLDCGALIDSCEG